MKVTFANPSQYWKPDVKPETYEHLMEELIPRSELVVYAKTSAIDPEHLDWWAPYDKETSTLLVVCLDMCGMNPPVTDYDTLFIRSENGVDVIKGIGHIGVTFGAEVYLWHIGLGKDGMSEDGMTQIVFGKRLAVQDWNYYKDLMHRSDKALRLYHSYEEREKEDRKDTKESLKPKAVWPIVATVLFFAIQVSEVVGGTFLSWASYILLLPAINYIIRLIRYLTYKV